MKKELLLILLILMIGISLAAQPARARYAPNHILVKLNSDAYGRSSLPRTLGEASRSFGINELDQIMQNRGGTSISPAHRQVQDSAWAQRVGWNRWFIINLDGRSSVEAALSSFRANRYVENAQPDYILKPSAIPNDPLNGSNWGHYNTGTNGPGTGIAGFDAKTRNAWDLPQGYGNADIIIAIIDTGVDIAHEDLRLMAGYDFGDNDSNPMDDSAEKGHGTACAGIAAAKANNGIGVAGVSGGSTVMPLKVANSAGAMYVSALNNALTYAADNGANIISLSLGIEDADMGEIPSTDNALSYAYNKGCAIFAAAGNENASHLNYPANHSNVIAVGAASPSGQRKSPSSSDGQNWWGSNYGVNTQDSRSAVDIMGPTILPTTDITGSAGYATGNYSTNFNGTSCATPYVAGVAALLLSANPALTNAQIRNILTSTATDMTADGGAGWDMYTGYGLVNAHAAVLTQYSSVPQLQISSPANNSLFGLGDTVSINATATMQNGSIHKLEFFVDNALKATLYSAPYTWQWDSSGYSLGNHQIKVVATSSDSQSAEASITLQLIAPADEGFETGDFSKYDWENNSVSPWTVQSQEKYAGSFAAKSGAIGNNGTTELKLNRTVTTAGEISFYFKTSSELNYDMLRFFIDGVQQGAWSGLRYDWAFVSFPVSVGDHSFSFRYTKDGSSTSGLDCAWIDHINLPPSTKYFAPPQNLIGVPADNEITLYWEAPNTQLSSYQIYKGNALLATTTNTVYTDYDVVNDTSYSYYVKAVYPEGISGASNTIEVTAGMVYEAYLGSGTNATGSSDGSPINIYYKSLHSQAVYTKAELNAQGIFGPMLLTRLAWDVVNPPLYPLTNFRIRIKHTDKSNVATWHTAAGLETVYTSASYAPQAGIGMIQLDSPFWWNGVDNILVDTAFGPISNWNSSGTVRYTSITNGFLFVRSDSGDQGNIFSAGSLVSSRPNLKMGFNPIPSVAQMVLNQDSFNFGRVQQGSYSMRELRIQNRGNATLEIAREGLSISGDSSFYFEELTEDISIPSNSERILMLYFQPQSLGNKSATLTIQSNAGNSPLTVQLSGEGVDLIIRNFPFTENFDGVSAPALPEGWLAINANNDEVLWATRAQNARSAPNCVAVGYNGTLAMNDYLISRPLAMEAGMRYNIEFYYRGETTNYIEKVKLRIGMAPTISGLSTQLLDLPNIRYTTYQKASVEYSCSQSGIYYLGWHGYSAANQYYLMLDDISISEIYDYPDGASISIGSGEDAITITVGNGNANHVAGGEIPPINNHSFSPAHEFVLRFYGSGPYNVNIATTALWGAYYQGGWQAVENSGGVISFTIDAAKGGVDIPFILGDKDPTLPVTLSSFAATIYSVNMVKIAWIAESETEHAGYNLYRSEVQELATASVLNNALITEGSQNGSQRHYQYLDSEVYAGASYYYWLESRSLNGEISFYGPVSVKILADDSQPEMPEIPLQTRLFSAFPNPFNPNTTLRYSLSEPGQMQLVIYNLKGQIIQTYSREHSAAGYYQVHWDGRDQSGKPVAAGIYFYRMQCGDYHSTKKMLLSK